jgi:hypothetical protein
MRPLAKESKNVNLNKSSLSKESDYTTEYWIDEDQSKYDSIGTRSNWKGDEVPRA